MSELTDDRRAVLRAVCDTVVPSIPRDPDPTGLWGRPATLKTIEPIAPRDDELELEADVCIVGSGAGGGVIAGTLAQRGLKVCVLEAAGYFNEADFNQLELWAYENMYWRGGPNPTADF